MSYSYGEPCIAPRPGLYVFMTPQRGIRNASPERSRSKSFFANRVVVEGGHDAIVETGRVSSISSSQWLLMAPGGTRSTSAAVTVVPAPPQAPALVLSGKALRS